MTVKVKMLLVVVTASTLWYCGTVTVAYAQTVEETISYINKNIKKCGLYDDGHNSLIEQFSFRLHKDGYATLETTFIKKHTKPGMTKEENTRTVLARFDPIDIDGVKMEHNFILKFLCRDADKCIFREETTFHKFGNKVKHDGPSAIGPTGFVSETELLCRRGANNLKKRLVRAFAHFLNLMEDPFSEN